MDTTFTHGHLADDFAKAFANQRLDTTDGGFLTGPGDSMSDDIDASMALGAFVLNAEVVRVIGKEGLAAIVSLCRDIRFDAKLSAGEYVVPAYAVAAMGRRFWHSLNDAGNLLREGVSLNGALHRSAMIERAADALQALMAIKQDSAARLHSRAAAAAEDSRNAPDDGVVRLAMGGLGIALGAAADEIDRQRTLDRMDAAGKRADEMLALHKRTTAAALAAQGIKNTAMQRVLDDDGKVRAHLDAWSQGRAAIQKGDYAPFMAAVNEYNADQGAWQDGYKLLPQNTPDGPVLNHVGPDGTVKATYGQQDAIKLFDTGMAQKLKFLNPTYFDRAHKESMAATAKAEDRAFRERVAKLGADARMYASDNRYDATVDAAGTRAEAQTEAARIRASAPRASGGLTAAQERANTEIDAAREQIAGMSQADILHRSQRATNTGRENPDFDPGIAKAASLAARRKIGHDPVFDGRTVPSPTTKRTPKQAAMEALAADPAMQGYSLGDQTVKGFKVLDANGNHIGYFGKQ
jgi:hypothetical protein